MPIISKREEEGMVSVTLHKSAFMYQPLVDHLIRTHSCGTACVLTQTNDEAVIVTALLRRYGVNGKLIQSMDGFSFWNMAEVRYFLKYIGKNVKTPLITDELWQAAKNATYSLYESSQSLVYLKRCLELFEETNKVKYFSDFKEFVFESSVEDFCDMTGADVVVSTIHKAKGREFDDVYMLVSDGYCKDDHLMRRYYVGITRAKNRLFIHTNGGCFNGLDGAVYYCDANQYPMPEEIVLQLSHRDVYLDYFKDLKHDILMLRAGDQLLYKDYYLYETKEEKPVAKLSQKMQSRLLELNEKGYSVKSASVRFVVAWKAKDAPKEEAETAVLLADLFLSM